MKKTQKTSEKIKEVKDVWIDVDVKYRLIDKGGAILTFEYQDENGKWRNCRGLGSSNMVLDILSRRILSLKEEGGYRGYECNHGPLGPGADIFKRYWHGDRRQ